MTNNSSDLERVRIDKWLWAARFFRTRALAAQACERGRATLNGTPAKPGKDVRVGDCLLVSTPSGDFELRIVLVSDRRGSASIAQTLYEETPASRAERARLAERQRLQPEPEQGRLGRPTKRDRRTIDRVRGSD